ncbi:MAG: hypothetical protein IJ106_02085 [Parasporobacterium sp.]|nr:hypothetical protein [Parasporobacterium sp.]
MKKFHDNFDYENAEADIWDAGGDPNALDYRNPAKRDKYLKDVGLNPKDYGSKWGDFSSLDQTGGSGSGQSGCYLTSACIRAAHLPDDCEELTVLRWFRDHYLKNLPGGEEDIREYYRIAPGIADAINRREDAENIWNRIYHDLILKCVSLIRDGDYQATYRMYKEYTLNLQESYL